MSAAYWSGQVARHLAEARKAHSKRIVTLNALARGEAIQTSEQQKSLVHSERLIRRLLLEISDGVTEKARVVTMEEVSATREALPKNLVEQYELLFCKAYGTDPAVSVGDSSVIRGVGKRETRTSSGQAEQRVPGAPPATKKYGQNQRNVVQDRRAYDYKIKIDRRLRKLAHEIAEELAGHVAVFEVNVCTHCARLGDDDWKWCPNCGGQMIKEER